MFIIEYLPVVLAGAGIGLRFWMSRETVQAPVVCAAPPASPLVPTRSASKPVSQQAELALA